MASRSLDQTWADRIIIVEPAIAPHRAGLLRKLTRDLLPKSDVSSIGIGGALHRYTPTKGFQPRKPESLRSEPCLPADQQGAHAE